MMNLAVPLLVTTGQDVVIVSALFLAHWTVIVCETPLTRVLPRRWLDIQGRQMNVIWEAGLRAVLGIILFKPGVTQVSCSRRSPSTPIDRN
jgi:transcription factor C subunit 3